MNLDDLRSAQTRERATDGLQDLRDSFYADVATFIEDLKDRRETAAEVADDPFGDPEVQELTDKVETAEQVAEAIYERRMGKLVKQASLAAAGMPDDEGGLTAEEQELYTDLVERIEANKAHVLDVVSGDADPVVDDGGETDSADTTATSDALDAGPANPVEAAGRDGSEPSESSAAAAMGGGLDDEPAEPEPAEPEPADSDTGADKPAPDAEPPDAVAKDLARVASDDGGPSDGDVGTTPDGGVQSEPAATGGAGAAAGGDGADTDRVRVRVTEDVGEILGVDERPYDLQAEDIVTLPEANATPLVEKDAAEELD